MRAHNVLIALLVAAACGAEANSPTDSGDSRDDAFLRPGGKADDMSALAHNPAVARVVLQVANTEPEPALLGQARIAPEAVRGIVSARPIESLAALDAVGFVGPIAFRQLLDYALARGFLRDPNGPDLAANAAELAGTTRVVHNAAPLPIEVASGCAVDTAGRSLLRFDLRVANRGPADLDFSDAACHSTRTDDPFCGEVDCSVSPECCRDDAYVCPTYRPNGVQLFEFEYPGGYLRFNSFAELHLYDEDGVAVTTETFPRSLAVTLADTGGLEPGDRCGAARPFTGRRQGLHARCSYTLSSALPCSFLDVTGLAPGEYIMEIRLDPLDLLDESDELNNVVRVPVEIDEAPVPIEPPDRPLFLVRDGVGNDQEASTYYDNLLPNGFVINSYTLNRFKSDFMSGLPTVTSVYRNAYDLGFWRDMTCTTTVDRGVGACAVTNYDEYDDEQNGIADLGTVAMRIDQRGRVQFFAFAPNGRLASSAELDDEGNKAIPRLCTPCHVGEYRGSTDDPDMGAIFREFEPALLEARPGIAQARAELEWKRLNQIVRRANRAVRSQEEGGFPGVNLARERMEHLIDEMYPGAADEAVPIDDPARVPPSWNTGSGSERPIKRRLWQKMVSKYCATCHRNSFFNFENYDLWATMSAPTNGVPFIEALIRDNPDDPNRELFPFMPQAKLQWERLRSDDEALLSLERWLEIQD